MGRQKDNPVLEPGAHHIALQKQIHHLCATSPRDSEHCRHRLRNLEG